MNIEEEKCQEIIINIANDVGNILDKYQNMYEMNLSKTISYLTYVYLDLMHFLFDDKEDFVAGMDEVVKDFMNLRIKEKKND